MNSSGQSECLPVTDLASLHLLTYSPAKLPKRNRKPPTEHYNKMIVFEFLRTEFET